MKILALDTSTENLSLALQIEDKLLVHRSIGQKTQAQTILEKIAVLLKEANLKVSDLEGIAFGKGPGSFTGVRVASSVVKGLAYPHNISVYPISTLAAIAQGAREKGYSESILALLDARMQELYWAFYPSKDFEAKEHLSSASEIKLEEKPALIAGVGFEAYSEQFNFPIEKAEIIYPEAANMIKLVNYGKIATISAKDAKPLYLRNTVTQGGKSG